MTKQQAVTLNLTKQEAECISMVFDEFRNSYFLNTKDTRPCKPFLDKLNFKIKAAINKK